MAQGEKHQWVKAAAVVKPPRTFTRQDGAEGKSWLVVFPDGSEAAVYEQAAVDAIQANLQQELTWDVKEGKTTQYGTSYSILSAKKADGTALWAPSGGGRKGGGTWQPKSVETIAAEERVKQGGFGLSYARALASSALRAAVDLAVADKIPTDIVLSAASEYAQWLAETALEFEGRFVERMAAHTAEAVSSAPKPAQPAGPPTPAEASHTAASAASGAAGTGASAAEKLFETAVERFGGSEGKFMLAARKALGLQTITPEQARALTTEDILRVLAANGMAA